MSGWKLTNTVDVSVSQLQKLSEKVTQAKERENESKQSGCEIILQEIRPMRVCLHSKCVTDMI